MVGSKLAGVAPVTSLSNSSSLKPTANLAAILAIEIPWLLMQVLMTWKPADSFQLQQVFRFQD